MGIEEGSVIVEVNGIANDIGLQFNSQLVQSPRLVVQVLNARAFDQEVNGQCACRVGKILESWFHAHVVGGIAVVAAWPRKAQVYEACELNTRCGDIRLNLLLRRVCERLAEHLLPINAHSQEVALRGRAACSIKRVDRGQEESQVDKVVRRKVGQSNGDRVAGGRAQERAREATSNRTQPGEALDAIELCDPGIDLTGNARLEVCGQFDACASDGGGAKVGGDSDKGK